MDYCIHTVVTTSHSHKLYQECIKKSTNCMGELALRSTCVSLTIAMQISCLVYTVILHVPVWLQVCSTVSGRPVRATPPREYPTVLFIGLWPHSFHKIMCLYSICLVSTTCCDATITTHKHNTNIQELRTLLNTLLILAIAL